MKTKFQSKGPKLVMSNDRVNAPIGHIVSVPLSVLDSQCLATIVMECRNRRSLKRSIQHLAYTQSLRLKNIYILKGGFDLVLFTLLYNVSVHFFPKTTLYFKKTNKKKTPFQETFWQFDFLSWIPIFCYHYCRIAQIWLIGRGDWWTIFFFPIKNFCILF